MNVDKRGSGAILKWLIIASGFFIRFWQLGKQSFWVDEIISLGMFKSPSSDISYFRKFLWDVHAPLYSLLLHFWSMVSQSEFWLRTPSALAGGISVFFLYKWLKETFNEKAALTGSLLLAISPFSLYYSQELRAYAMLNLFVILSLIAFRRFDIKPNLKSAATLGFVLALTCLIHTSALLLCIGIFVYSVA
ncbi:MAG TPA: glycosyltransferase family 39 protein, partial [Candidatus Krumholzibacteriaceae bacterium]|nr:glycosyltransferase family 39 protein [Candidatus Krumholzibacteriaceae bacterium]